MNEDTGRSPAFYGNLRECLAELDNGWPESEEKYNKICKKIYEDVSKKEDVNV